MLHGIIARGTYNKTVLLNILFTQNYSKNAQRYLISK